jgi:hypothetical protein
MRIALFYYVLAQTTSGVSINRDTSSTRGKAGGSPLTPLQYNLIFCSFDLLICFFQGRRLIPPPLHGPPFKAPSGGGLGKPPANYVKRGRVSSGSALFVLHSKQTKDSFSEVLNYEWPE